MFPLSPRGSGGQAGEGEHERRNKALTAPSRFWINAKTLGREELGGGWNTAPPRSSPITPLSTV